MKEPVDDEMVFSSGDLMSKTIKQTDERVAEVKRRAEEAVSDVKRQAVVELQKAVRAAEEKANEAVATAHAKMEKAVLEARRQATEETLSVTNHQSDSSEVRNFASSLFHAVIRAILWGGDEKLTPSSWTTYI